MADYMQGRGQNGRGRYSKTTLCKPHIPGPAPLEEMK